MPIKFPELLQESWNFMRNQRSFSLTAFALLFALQAVITFIVPTQQAVTSENSDAMANISLLPIILLSGANLLLSLLIILNIKAIVTQTFQHFFQPLGKALTQFLPALLISFLMVMPLSIGVSFGLMAGLGQSSLSLIALPLMITGIYIFVKLSLSLYVYLLEEPQKKVFESLSFMWKMSRGRMLPLMLYCVIAQLVPVLFSTSIGSLGNNMGVQMVSMLISAALNLFIVIFGFRFYQVYRKAD